MSNSIEDIISGKVDASSPKKRSRDAGYDINVLNPMEEVEFVKNIDEGGEEVDDLPYLAEYSPGGSKRQRRPSTKISIDDIVPSAAIDQSGLGNTGSSSQSPKKQSKPRAANVDGSYKKPKGKECEFEGCEKQPHYNFREAGRGGRFCSLHKQDGMVDIVNKRCEEEGCHKQPHYNIQGIKGGRFCAKHKQEGMVDVVSKKCLAEGCMKQPLYNHPGERGGKYCTTHKEEGMVNVCSKKCEEPECKKQPHYNFYGEKRGRFCSAHKHEGMLDVVGKRCEEDGCIKHPIYNHPGESRRMWCNKHKKEDMVYIQYKNIGP